MATIASFGLLTLLVETVELTLKKVRARKRRVAGLAQRPGDSARFNRAFLLEREFDSGRFVDQ